MKNVNSISFKTLDDKSLNVLYANLAREINVRAEAKAAKREKWAREMYTRYLAHPHSVMQQIGEITIVSTYNDFYNILSIGVSRPASNDKYNERVGIAVAFAKATGEHIPDYI